MSFEVFTARRRISDLASAVYETVFYDAMDMVLAKGEWQSYVDAVNGKTVTFRSMDEFLTHPDGLAVSDLSVFFGCLIVVSESKAEVAPEARELRRLLVAAGMTEPQRPLHLGDSPEVLAEAISRQFTVEQRRALVKALQSPELRVSRQEADRLRKRAMRGTDLTARACEHCGKVFEPKRSIARFCSGSCRAKASQGRKDPAAPVIEPEVSAAEALG